MVPFSFLQGARLNTKMQTESVANAAITITAGRLMFAFCGLFLLNLLLRVFYLRYDFVNGDEGVRALTAVRMLEGARLYAEVVTDKPPGASLFYAAIFTLVGRSMKSVHLAATLWNCGTSLIVYLIAARFYNRRIGLTAGLLFVYFSTNYFTQDIMAANTELLMALPYAAGFYLFITAVFEKKLGPGSGARLVAAGLLTGFAALFKQIGLLNLVFFAIYEILAAWNARTSSLAYDWLMGSIRRIVVHLSLIAVGFTLVIGAFVIWLASMGALRDFWQTGIVFNTFYIDSEPFGSWLKFMMGRGLSYVFFNALLWYLAGLAVYRLMRRIYRIRNGGGEEARSTEQARFEFAAALWCAVSLLSVAISGRFYGHYFISALPALSLLGARGWNILTETIGPPYGLKARVIIVVLFLLFLIGLFRSHHRTLVLAYETLTGTRTRFSGNWGMTKREQEAEVIADFVRARVPAGEPLYIWGYAHDVFWRTRCRPASRYLTPSYIDGRFPDAESTVPDASDDFRREAADKLIEDLRRNKPRLILDIEGSFKTLPYADLIGFIENNYFETGNAGPNPARPFRVLELKSEIDESHESGECK